MRPNPSNTFPNMREREEGSGGRGRKGQGGGGGRVRGEGIGAEINSVIKKISRREKKRLYGVNVSNALCG